jgi:L-threonylcarbamoyladenylate synthase
MLEKHYAPNCTVELVDDRKNADARFNQLNGDGRSSEIIDFGEDLKMFAHELYARLRDADRRLVDVVITVKPPMTGIGIAINERLKKASNSTWDD